jgi:hypothetical protein
MRRTQYFDRTFAFGAFDHSIQSRSLISDGFVRLKLVRRDLHQTLDPIDDHTDRGVAAQYDDAALLGRFEVW